MDMLSGVYVRDADIPRKLLQLQNLLYSQDCIHQTHMTGKTYETRVGNRRNLMLPQKFRCAIHTYIVSNYFKRATKTAFLCNHKAYEPSRQHYQVFGKRPTKGGEFGF